MIPKRAQEVAFTILLPLFLATLIGGKRPGMDATMTTAWLTVVWTLGIVLSIVGIDYFSFAENQPERNLKRKHPLGYFLLMLGQFFGGGCCLGLGLSLLVEFGERPLYILNQLIGLVILDAGIVLLVRSAYSLRFLRKMWTSREKLS